MKRWQRVKPVSEFVYSSFATIRVPEAMLVLHLLLLLWIGLFSKILMARSLLRALHSMWSCHALYSMWSCRDLRVPATPSWRTTSVLAKPLVQ